MVDWEKLKQKATDFIEEQDKLFQINKSEKRIKVKLSSWFKKDGKTIHIRRDANDLFYFSWGVNTEAPRFKFIGYVWSGPDIQTRLVTHTTGKTKTKGRAGSAIVGGMIAGKVGAIAGASRSKKGIINETSISEEQQDENKTPATLYFQNIETKEMKEINILNDSKKDTEIRNFLVGITINSDSSQPMSIPDEIRKYKQLMDKGIISPEEFNQKKNDLLNSQ